MNKPSQTLSYILLVLFFLSLAGCKESSVKRDLLAPPVSDEFTPNGHILSQTKVEDVIDDGASIPSVVNSQRPQLPPLRGSTNTKLYSVSAVNVPVADLMFKLAKDANKELDIYSGIQGNVTINAINQTLDSILERVANQVGFVFSIENTVVSIKPDFPEWKNYKVDYVNIQKKTTDTIDMKMSVSSGGGAASGGGQASSTKVTVKSEHDFWSNLEKNIQLLAQIDPNANLVIASNTGSQSDSPSTSGATLSGLSQNTVVNAEAGVISVYTSTRKHKAIKQYIEEVTTRAERQVLIEATVVEVTLNDQYQAGIDWSKFGSLGFTSDAAFFKVPAAGGTENILDQLKFLKTFGDSKVLSSPKIMAINNQTALLKVVNNLVYFTVDVDVTEGTNGSSTTKTFETEVHTVPVGFTMSVTPFVSAVGDVTLNVRPTISRAIDFIQDPNPELAGIDSFIPVVQEKEMSSVLKLKDRQIAIIGGLIEDKNSNDRVGLPWLGDAPIFGDLFSQRDNNTTKSELVIFIRPVVVKNPDVDNGDLSSVRRFLKSKAN